MSDSTTITTPTGLHWSGVTYDIPVKKSILSKVIPGDAEKAQPEEPTRRILNNLSGHVDRGEFVGILGASGAGKTTLLNVLSARMGTTGTLSGRVTFDGNKRKGETWKRIVGYVQQDDALLPRATVRETIEMASMLRLSDKAFSRAEKMDRAQGVMDMLRLEDCAESRIGNDALRGVSGGERKRTSIGIELVSDVSMLFLDEPTSGLDSYAANLLVNNVAQIVKDRQLSCLMTVHQPSWAMFTRLDRVILLAKGGVYYDGPPRETIPWFKELGYEVPEGVNPADHFISIAEGKEVENLLARWKEGHLDVQEKNEGDGGMVKQEYPTSLYREFILLQIRWARESARDTQTLLATLGQTIIIILIAGFGFFRLNNTQDDVLPKVGVLFFIAVNTSFSVIAPLITAFPVQRALMKRERASGLYRAFTAWTSRLLLEVPFAVITRIPYFAVVYFMVGLRPKASAFFIFLGVQSVYLMQTTTLALAIGAVSPTVEIAQILNPLVNVIFLLFGGPLLPAPPPWFVWLKWISPITYVFSATLQNEYAGQNIDCTGGAQCYQTGDAVVQAYNAGVFTIAQDVGFLVALTAACFVLGYIALGYSTGPRFRII